MRYDVVVWGATGFTGALVAEYLARHAGEARWAIAGRSRDKLEALRARLGDVPVLLADAGDPASLRALARQAKVVCTTVGPYARYGAELVAACVEEGAHCCDLTGEPTFVRQMIDRHHHAARERGVRIVHSCGFDSVPSDLGVLLAEDRALEALGRPLPDVTLYVGRVRGGFSGGTVASAFAMAEDIATDRRLRKVAADPYSLLPEGAPRGPEVRDVRGLGRDRREGVWTAPFLMAGTNAKLVRRTNALLDHRYGADFRYEEVTGSRSLLAALGTTASLAAMATVISVPLLRRAAARFLPAPGEGPDAEARARGFFELAVVARDDRAEVRVQVRGDQDPGYGATSGMLAESALCLALDPLPPQFGVTTPAAALGHALAARLPRAGVTFTVTGP